MAKIQIQKLNEQPDFQDTIYNTQDILDYCDTHWRASTSLQTMKKLNEALGNILDKKPIILVSGTNGKSSTIHFLTQLLTQEHIHFGTLTSPHLNLYNERISYNGHSISTESFTKHAQTVLYAARKQDITITTKELLLATACLYFIEKDVDLIILENNTTFGIDPTLACTPIIHAITRLIEPGKDHDIFQTIQQLTSNSTTKTHIISADQNKLHLQLLKQATIQHFSSWIMPIRKVVALPYPYEQIYGRCAALAEKIAFVCVELFPDLSKSTHSIISKQVARRGRPSLQDIKKAQQEKSLSLPQFWQQITTTTPGHFQIIMHNNARYLLDIAPNTDALENVLLGIRLLHYKQQAKHLQLIIGYQEQDIDVAQLIKRLVSFFKKMTGTILVCPVTSSPGEKINNTTCDVVYITNMLKGSGLRAIACDSLEDALQKSLHNITHPDSLTVVTGAQDVIKEFYRIEKL